MNFVQSFEFTFDDYLAFMCIWLNRIRLTLHCFDFALLMLHSKVTTTTLFLEYSELYKVFYGK